MRHRSPEQTLAPTNETVFVILQLNPDPRKAIISAVSPSKSSAGSEHLSIPLTHFSRMGDRSHNQHGFDNTLRYFGSLVGIVNH